MGGAVTMIGIMERAGGGMRTFFFFFFLHTACMALYHYATPWGRRKIY